MVYPIPCHSDEIMESSDKLHERGIVKMKRWLWLIISLSVMLWWGTGIMAAPVSPADQKEILRAGLLGEPRGPPPLIHL